MHTHILSGASSRAASSHTSFAHRFLNSPGPASPAQRSPSQSSPCHHAGVHTPRSIRRSPAARTNTNTYTISRGRSLSAAQTRNTPSRPQSFPAARPALRPLLALTRTCHDVPCARWHAPRTLFSLCKRRTVPSAPDVVPGRCVSYGSLHMPHSSAGCLSAARLTCSLPPGQRGYSILVLSSAVKCLHNLVSRTCRLDGVLCVW